MFHVPQISEGVVEHYSEDYPTAIELAETNSTYSVMDSDALQFFAIEAYAYDVAVPGEGCAGEYEEETSSAPAPAASATATPTAAESATTASSAAQVSRHMSIS